MNSHTDAKIAEFVPQSSVVMYHDTGQKAKLSERIIFSSCSLPEKYKRALLVSIASSSARECVHHDVRGCFSSAGWSLENTIDWCHDGMNIILRYRYCCGYSFLVGGTGRKTSGTSCCGNGDCHVLRSGRIATYCRSTGVVPVAPALLFFCSCNADPKEPSSP
jgi:hypothetical protein